jgi:hypothetical protein
MMNASPFIPVDATSGSGVSSHSTTGANTPAGFALQTTSASAFVPVLSRQQADVGATSKSGKLSGREKGAYRADEHIALLHLFSLCLTPSVQATIHLNGRKCMRK